MRVAASFCRTRGGVVSGLRAPTGPTDRALEASVRARSMMGAPIHYRLRNYNGGRDPFATDPATRWTDEHGFRHATCDCAGFAAWCLGFDRYQPEHFPYWGGWINTDSAIWEALHDARWFKAIELAEPGCL